MTAEQLLLAIGEIKEETVLAADHPRKRPVTHLRVAVTAVAAAVVIGVLGCVGLLRSQQNKPPVGDPIPPTVTSAVPSTTTQPSGTGGDMNACQVHSYMYHRINGRLPGLVSEEEMNEYHETHPGEEFNILSFVEYFDITREEYISSQGWEEKLDEPAKAHHPRAPYTYGQFVDAIYGDDEELTAWVFSPELNTLL